LPTVSASLSVDKTDVYVGDTLTFSGSATINGEPFSGATVLIAMLLEETSPEGWTAITQGLTNTDGSFSLIWTVPSTVAGIDITNSSRRFKAYVLKQINTEVYSAYSNEVTVYIRAIPLPVEVKIVDAKIKDVATGVIFNVYQGEPAFVTYNPDFTRELFDIYFKIKNVTDHKIEALMELKDVGTFSAQLNPGEEWGGWRWLNVFLRRVLPVELTFKAWTEGGAVDAISFIFDHGNFLWINSELPCKVEISGELKYQRPEEGLYIFPHNAPVSLLAIPPFCHVFKNWVLEWKESGKREGIFRNPIEFTLTENCSATVYFEPAR